MGKAPSGVGLKVALPLTGIILATSPLWGIDINEKLSADIAFSAVYQWADFSGNARGDTGKGSVATDIGLNFHPTDEDQLQLTFSFAAGNGLKKTFEEKGFLFMPNADDLEDDLKDINGRNRDYILEAWYMHTFKGKDFSFSLTGGIIDATAYIDDNALANDELLQFMNDVFVNNPVASLPSYDLGGVAELDIGSLSLKGLVMNSKTDGGRNYDYYALQAGFSSENPLGEGNYRVYYFRTTKDFPTAEGNFDYLEGIGISLDQRVGKDLGLFGRFGINTHTETGDLREFYSGGAVIGNLPLKGELGIGIAHSVGNKKISSLKGATTGELYYKIALNGYAFLTFDLQRDREEFEDETLQATTFGIRLTAFF